MNNQYNYPKIQKIHKIFKKIEGDFTNVHILACQHILSPQAFMFDMINKSGIPKENIHIFGKIYSTNKIVLNDLKTKGFDIIEHEFNQNKYFDIQHKENCDKEFYRIKQLLGPNSRLILLDDGGELIKTALEYFKTNNSNMITVGVEQTSSGFRKLEDEKLLFPIFNVARSNTKLKKESPIIAKIGTKRINETINQYNIKPRILISGLGPIGSSIKKELDKKYFCVGYDIKNNERENIVDVIIRNRINLVVGCVGKYILSKNQLEHINKNIIDKLFLISMSSSDREFDSLYFRNNQINIGPHTDIQKDNIILINNGFPITFRGNAFESTPQEIENTISLLYKSVLSASILSFDTEKKFIDIDLKSKIQKNKEQIKVEILKYSQSEQTGKRISTFKITIPKFVWGHIISHRLLSRNSASSRAIPAKKIRWSVISNPYLPVYFGKNKPGMQSGEKFTGTKLFISKKVWLWSRYIPIMFHFVGEKISIHKEILNRMLEPWLMVDIIVTSTEWSNFLNLRIKEDTQPETRLVAEKINSLLKFSKPTILKTNEWHLPFILKEEENLDINTKKKISVARCARVSYATFDGKTSNINNDLKLYDKLSYSGHWSPFEHVAKVLDQEDRYGNFIGWMQHRKEFYGENGDNGL